jgi:hypothetical protein
MNPASLEIEIYGGKKLEKREEISKIVLTKYQNKQKKTGN